MSLTSYFKVLDKPTNKNKQKEEEEEEKKQRDAEADTTVAAAAAAESSSTEAAAATSTTPSRKRKANTDADSTSPPSSPAATTAASSSSPSSSSTPSKKAKLDPSELDELASMIPSDWAAHLAPEFKKPYWPSISKFLHEQAAAKAVVFPPRSQIFRALDLCPFDSVKVVILGQDPYHGPNQAEGLSFSVPVGTAVPSSLQNIYKELAADLGEKKFTKPKHGNLIKWAQQGVLLLNTGLTVKAHMANSHKNAGWQHFTDAIIKGINKEKRGVVFILWGKHAQDKAKFIDKNWHHVLMSAHPSGLSAHRGFFGCKHFSKTNELLEKQGKTPIDWQV